MKIFVQAKPNSREEKVEKIDDTHFTVSVKEPPVQGRANRAICKLLGIYFDVPASHVTIILGHRTRRKIIGITDHPY